ncbi:Glycine/D-amino acid oxidase [Lutibacter oricola]|uniref:Glycine/D-amino acid oxidase n=1 Tax=Lutibacter oricola TaxID=762486 RepID=A0A1H3BC19_9FLAO|nr:FAD-binding oxidoreductase [Lutibacter oricola]SDX39456.1 Glycine/D-amino acid oxidase [Lutibacter oricola]
MNVDYIIVGLGLAGLAFVKELEKNKKTFVVFENESQNSSLVAGGMYNPVILKRFTPVWNGIEQIETALPFYAELEKQFKKKYHYKVDIYRIFKSIEEQNNWFVASDKPKLSPYMSVDLIQKKYKGIESEYGFGKLVNTGRIDSNQLIKDYRNYLLENNLLIKQEFKHNAIEQKEDGIIYESISAKKIVFCEGFGLKQNPFFNKLPMQEAKGELLTIYAPNLNVDFLVKAAVFVMPLGDNLYKVGATFNWKDKTKVPTKEGKFELVSKLDTFINVPYKIVDHLAGIRPTINDRRPIIGKHPLHTNLAVLNGLGTRGVIIAPTMANMLYNHLEFNAEITSDVSINRFAKLF